MTARAALDQIAAAEGWEIMPYSGRWMYGRECCSIRLVDEQQLVLAMLRAARDPLSVDAVLALAAACQRDDLGLGVVVYWPDLAP